MRFAGQGHCSDERRGMGRSSERVSFAGVVLDICLDANISGLVS